MPIELSTNIILEPNIFRADDGTVTYEETDVKRFQHVYSSQLYGTFFSIFARFHCSEAERDKVQLEKIDFLLMNYKGPVLMKIVPEWDDDDQFTFFPQDASVETRRSLDIPLWVQAKVDDEELITATSTVNGETASDNQVGKLDMDSQILTLDLINHPQFKGKYLFKPKDYIRINRRLRKMSHGDSSRKSLRQKAFVNGHFDSEFFVQDGAYIFERKINNGDVMSFRTGNITVAGAITRPINRSVGAPGYRCTPSDSSVNPGP